MHENVTQKTYRGHQTSQKKNARNEHDHGNQIGVAWPSYSYYFQTRLDAVDAVSQLITSLLLVNHARSPPTKPSIEPIVTPMCQKIQFFTSPTPVSVVSAYRSVSALGLGLTSMTLLSGVHPLSADEVEGVYCLKPLTTTSDLSSSSSYAGGSLDTSE